MPLRGYSDYSDVNWFMRAVRAVPVIAGAALIGGLIGGFAVFAVDSALTWEPASQGRPDGGTDNQASVQTGGQSNPVEQHATKPVRVVGGAIPDPSAGMSAPPPAPQQRSTAPARPPIASELLTPNPLGPATQLQPQSATASSAPPPQNLPPNQTSQTSVQTPSPAPSAAPSPAGTQKQQTRWPDALSRAHQNTANAPSPPPQAATAPAAPIAGASQNAETQRNNTDSNRPATADNQDRVSTRHSRHSRQPMFNPNAGGYANDNDSGVAPSQRRQTARSYERLYDSSGNQTQRSYRDNREPFYGAARGEDQDDTGYRSDPRRYGRDARYRNKSRVITREQPSDQTLDSRQRSEPFWGGGFFGRGYQDDD